VLSKSFTFETADEVSLLNSITPEAYRKIINKSADVFASAPECRMLKQLYAEIDTTSQKILGGLLSKLSCDTTDLASFVQQEEANKVHAASISAVPVERKASVFTIL